ncbi:MAG: acyltransferase [Clostridia bacterium]|nr:acyltransferase [Clostridia bacterium]
MKTKKLSAAYNPEVDFWKFFFAVIIFVFHSGGIINGGNPIKLGYLGVEFFFIVSGYFLAAKVRSDEARGVRTPTSEFMKRKISGIYRPFLAAFIIAFTTRCIAADLPFIDTLKNLLLSLFEVLLVRMYGFPGYNMNNGPTWYISSMMIAMVMLYPLMAKYRRPFLRIACPVITLFFYGYYAQRANGIGFSPADKVSLLIFSGYTIRAFPGLCLGAFVNECCALIKERKIRTTKAGCIVFAGAELLALAWILFYMIFAYKLKWAAVCMYSMPAALAFFCFIVFSELTGIKRLLRGIDFSVFSKLSLYLYLSHRVILRLLDGKTQGMSNLKIYAIYIGLTLCSMALCRLLVFLFDLYTEKCSPKIKNLFRREDVVIDF